MQILVKRVQKSVSITEHQPKKLPLLASFNISGSVLRIILYLGRSWRNRKEWEIFEIFLR